MSKGICSIYFKNCPKCFVVWSEKLVVYDVFSPLKEMEVLCDECGITSIITVAK